MRMLKVKDMHFVSVFLCILFILIAPLSLFFLLTVPYRKFLLKAEREGFEGEKIHIVIYFFSTVQLYCVEILTQNICI